MKLEKVPIDKLIKDPVNARKHGEKNLESIKGSLAKFGQQKPIVVNNDNVVVAGNGTLEAARQLGWKEINVVRTELTGTDITAFGLADNRTSELATWDMDVLPELLASLQELDFDLSSIGFDADDLDKLMPEEIEPGLTDDDAVPENVETRCKPGDLWILGNHRLLCGDSTNVQHVERLMNGQKADMVFTDPPYGVGYKYNSHDDDVTKEQHAQFSKDLINLALSISDRFIITPGCYNLDLYCKISEPNHIGCWTKTNAMSPGRVTHFWTWEPIFFYGKWSRKRGNDVFNFPVSRQPDTGGHTCPKPLALWQDIVENFSDQKDKILDFFLGSGSTLIACEKTNRKCYGMEIDPHYCDVILKRWEDYTGKQAVLST